MQLAVSVYLERRFLILRMGFLQPAHCRSELETVTCAFGADVRAPASPAAPSLLTNFMHTSQQHPERERDRSPLLPPPPPVTPYSLKGDHFPQVLKQISFAYFCTPLAFSTRSP